MAKNCDLIISLGNNEELVIKDAVSQESDSYIQAVASFLKSHPEDVDKILNSIDGYYKKKFSITGSIGNTSVQEIVNNMYIEGGWPDISSISTKDNYNILYVDRDSFVPFYYDSISKVYVVYANGLEKLNDHLVLLSTVQKIDKVKDDKNFNKVFKEAKKLSKNNDLDIKTFLTDFLNNK